MAMVKEIGDRKYQGVCRKCPCFEDSLHTDSGIWCYWFKDDDKPDCSTRLALETLEAEVKNLKSEQYYAYESNRKEMIEFQLMITELKDSLAKAQALIEKWKQDAHNAMHPIEGVYFQCADELEKALGVDGVT